MKPIFSLLFLLISSAAFAQNGYWQQEVEYEMNIDFDVNTHRFTGEQSTEYTNNSPDTLKKVFYHLYFNAFQPGSMMDVRSRTIEDPDPRIADRIQKLKPDEIGYHRIKKLEQDGKSLSFDVVGTVAEVKLKKPIPPGKSTTFDMVFESQVPVQIRRSGRSNNEGVDYTLTQWYPKLAEYDEDGWHSEPYVAREFHGVFGNFDVKITIDSSFTLAGTGVVQNPDEVGHGYSDKSDGEPRHTWHFKAERVHDFAWAADDDYQHHQTTIDNGTILHFFHLNDSLLKPNWSSLIPYTAELFEIMNTKFGTYPYPQFSVIQGGDGGMEYPMCTMISGGGSFGGLVSVTVHEAIHNWYYGVLASNESKYPWMDEGFTTYAQNIVLDSLFEHNKVNPHERRYNSYLANVRRGSEEPMTTNADHYLTNRNYGVNAYSKGCVFLHQLSSIVGNEAFEKGMKSYFNQWKFKHPTPTDFKHVMEQASELELDWYFDAWLGTTKTIDYGIHHLSAKGDETVVHITNHGDIPFPVEVKVSHASAVDYYYIPLQIMRGHKPTPEGMQKTWHIEEDWPWPYPTYKLQLPYPIESINKIDLDPFHKVADTDVSNGVYPSQTISYPPDK